MGERIDSIRARLKAARIVGGLVKNTAVFKLKRKALRKRFRFEDVNLVIVDMDGTLFESDAGLEGLKLSYDADLPDDISDGEYLYNFILKGIAAGKYSVEQGIILGNELLMEKNFTLGDFHKVLDIVKGGIRIQLVAALKKLKARTGANIVLATHSSAEFAEMLSDYLGKQFGFRFDAVVGTRVKLDANGKITGLHDMVGLKNTEVEGIASRTKYQAIQDLCREKGWPLDLSRALLVTDSYGDIDLAKLMKTILIKAKTPQSLVQRVSLKLKLADYIVPDDGHLAEEFAKIMPTS